MIRLRAPVRSLSQLPRAMSGKSVTLFLCGDVMIGRGIDQILPQSCRPHLYEGYVTDARQYVCLAEAATG